MSPALQEVLAMLLMMPPSIDSYIVSILCHGIAWLIVGCITNVTEPSYRTRKRRGKNSALTNFMTTAALRIASWFTEMLAQSMSRTNRRAATPVQNGKSSYYPRYTANQSASRRISRGKGTNKLTIQTRKWLQTGTIVCLLSTASAKSNHRKTTFNSDSVTIHVDNCASRCITNNRSDFIKAPKRVIGRVKGMGSNNVAVQGIGTIQWFIDDDNGRKHKFLIPGSLYIPESPARLFSPQHWAQEQKDNSPQANGTWQATYADHVQLVWGQRRFKRTIPFDKANVATFETSAGSRNFRIFNACHNASLPTEDHQPSVTMFNTLTVTDDEYDDNDMSDDESVDAQSAQTCPASTENDKAPPEHLVGYKEDTRNHTTSYDAYTKHVNVIEDDLHQTNGLKLDPTGELLLWHYRLAHLPFTRLQNMAKSGELPSRLKECRVPKCSACLYGKMTRRPKRTKGGTRQIGSETVTRPGDCVSVDQLESSTLGLIGHMKGTPTTQRYKCATVYVDHFSRLSFVHLQKTLSSDDTVQSKMAFEKYCEDRGVVVRHYHADNGRFADKGFVNHATSRRQSITYCGVNAHFQNGVAEKRIRDLQEQATTMLLHAEAKWPKVISANLWPYALRMANDSLNATPATGTGITAERSFGNHDIQTAIKHFHPFGCPTYVLNDKLAAGKSIKKWHKRARLGIYLGRSPNHAQSVALILNLNTGLVSPQFHIAYDDLFETVKEGDHYDSTWQNATHFRKNIGRLGSRGNQATGVVAGNHQHTIDMTSTNHGTSELKTINKSTNIELPAIDSIKHAANGQGGDVDDQPPTEATGKTSIGPRNVNDMDDLPSSARRWSRRHKPTQRLIESRQQAIGLMTEMQSVDDDQYDGEIEYDIQRQMADPIAFAASSDPDTMYLHEAMKQPDREKFIDAMVKEVNTHTERGHWEVISRSSVPDGTDILPAVWAMKRKRKILTREVYKWKARLNVHGGKQKLGINYWETYAAALKWSSIRFFLTQIVINRWHTRQIDFVLAYPQADVECDLYLEIPQGFTFNGERKTHCLKLLKNLYGSKAAGRVWQQHLFRGLSDIGFTQSATDECVFYRNRTIFMVYTDDGILCGPDKADIDACLLELSQRFEITDEGDIDEYLGVKVTTLTSGQITLTQPHLIDSIISDMGFKANTKEKPTPAPSTLSLNRDINGSAHDESWDYRSIIGKLNFLEKSTRPDIAFAVHQCARYSSNPKQSHSAAVRYIVRYLIGTKDQGLILTPTQHSFECFVDADFLGGWNPNTAETDSTTAKSRSAHIVMYAGCPITWSSKMQTDIALSTTESEYSALSEAAREVLWLMGLMNEVREKIVAETVTIPTIRCTIFEDNEGAKIMATLPKLRPRTKHINVRMHHFRGAVASGLIRVESIDTSDQLADIATKPLAKDLFTRLRRKIMGW